MLKLGDLDLTPVLTHPERNPILQENLGRVLGWADRGCVVQITASALTARWGERPISANLRNDFDVRGPILVECI
jgi:tyrosine-protein phosphatase YwqE